MARPLVFFDIAGKQHGSLLEFYDTVFGWKADEHGMFTVPTATRWAWWTWTGINLKIP